MDAFELNKIAGGVLFAALILFGSKTVAEILFAAHAPEKPGYEVEIADEGAGEETTDDGKDKPSLAALLNSGDVAKGQKVAKKCAQCHTFEQGGKKKTGPNLYGILGKSLGAVEGFSYSSALRDKGGNWGYAELDAFLADPKGWLPGTKMAFKGIKKPAQRANLILYLRSLSDSPMPLPEAAAAVAEPKKMDVATKPTQ